MGVKRQNDRGFVDDSNRRLFATGLRKWLHEARFNWLQKRCDGFWQSGMRIVEFGCFDARSLAYLPDDFASYSGFDAGWEGGLSRAQSR